MKDMIINAVGKIDDDMIESVDVLRQKRRKHSKVKLAAVIAACLCIAAGCVIFAINRSDTRDTDHVQTWNPAFTADMYFKDCEPDNSSEVVSSDAILSFAYCKDFSDKREKWEAKGMIPVMETHPLFDAYAFYNKDGSLYGATISWHRRDAEGLEHYSDLTVTAGYDELKRIEDCIIVPEPSATVTKRDGIDIVARGGEDQNKTLTFQNESGWYQISGSFNDSYEDVVALLDWVWEHPVDFTEFTR